MSRVTLCLGIGVALSLLVTFAHDDPGAPSGADPTPKASAFLVLLAVAGARRVYRWAKGSLGEDWGRRALLGGLVGTAIAAMLLVVHHGAALRRQAEIHESVYSFFETDPRFEHSVVIAPPYMTVWRAQPRFAWTGSFVFEWQRPFPGNRVIFAYDRPKAVELLARDFPDRRFYLVERGGGVGASPTSASAVRRRRPRHRQTDVRARAPRCSCRRWPEACRSLRSRRG
ncbi:MAG: hypothetical protein R3A78_01115 [Polyangiales bacterium]